jgi:hypothetical protein
MITRWFSEEAKEIDQIMTVVELGCGKIAILVREIAGHPKSMAILFRELEDEIPVGEDCPEDVVNLPMRDGDVFLSIHSLESLDVLQNAIDFCRQRMIKACAKSTPPSGDNSNTGESSSSSE